MGITIHYHGRVNPKVRTKEFYLFAGFVCKEKGWAVSDLIETDGKAMLPHPDGDIPYTGKLSTFRIDPHEHCEPITFQITAEGYFKNWCKTQFAPLEICHTRWIDVPAANLVTELRQMERRRDSCESEAYDVDLQCVLHWNNNIQPP